MDQANFEQAKQYALHRLEQELSPNLIYHGVSHTRDDVVPAVERLAKMEGITGDAFFLILTAAWFHDLGFIEQSLHHELISARIATQALPRFGYDEEQIESIRWAILATALPQSPQNLLEQILTDADLDVLGRDDFMVSNAKLRRELSLFGKEYTDKEWIASQIKFVESHAYFTNSARTLRNEGKINNILYLKELLPSMKDIPLQK